MAIASELLFYRRQTVCYACMYFNSRIVEEFIHHDPKLIMACDKKERTPLHIASQCGHLEVARVICSGSNGFEVLEAVDENGNTPLHLACVGGNATVVQLLLDNGASMTAANSRGEVPVHTASQYKSVEIVEQLLKNGDHTMIGLIDGRGFTALHHAAENNQIKIITFLHQQ